MCLDTNLQFDFHYDHGRKMLVQLLHYTKLRFGGMKYHIQLNKLFLFYF